MKKLFISVFLIGLLLFSGVALADYCIDNQTLLYELNITVNNVTRTISYTEFCAYGCNNETLECNPEPFKVNLFVFLGIIGFFIILGLVLKLFGVI